MPDAPIQPNWRKCLNFPTLRSCERCGAICDQDGISVHDKGHRESEKAQISTCGICEGSGFYSVDQGDGTREEYNCDHGRSS